MCCLCVFSGDNSTTGQLLWCVWFTFSLQLMFFLLYQRLGYVVCYTRVLCAPKELSLAQQVRNYESICPCSVHTEWYTSACFCNKRPFSTITCIVNEQLVPICHQSTIRVVCVRPRPSFLKYGRNCHSHHNINFECPYNWRSSWASFFKGSLWDRVRNTRAKRKHRSNKNQGGERQSKF